MPVNCRRRCRSRAGLDGHVTTFYGGSLEAPAGDEAGDDGRPEVDHLRPDRQLPGAVLVAAHLRWLAERSLDSVMPPDLLAAFPSASPTGDGWSAQCPAHDDHRASLSIGRGTDDRWLLHCHAGCDLDAILQAAHLERRDLFPTNGHGKSQISATYDYTNGHGELVFQVVRFEPKNFRQRRPGGPDGWIWNTRGIPPLVYRRHEIQGREAVIVVEGEKDVDTLAELGLPATCNAGGSGKWKPAHAAQLVQAAVKRVVVIPDADTPGRSHAGTVARSCLAAGLSVKLVTLPQGAKDVSAWREGGGTKCNLNQLIKSAAAWSPTAKLAATDDVSDVPVVQTLSRVTRERIDWLWEPRVALRKLTLVAGEPGGGKSSMTLDMTARLTQGTTWPDGSPAPPGDVLLLSAEDGLADTIGPRLDACGADSARVHALTAVRQIDGTERGLDLSRDLPSLEAALRQTKPVLVIIDPLSAYLGRTDSWRDSEVRAVLAPLVTLGERYDCAVVGILHLTKNAAAKVLNRIMGSVAFVAAARIVLAVAADPDDETRRLLLPVKNNLAPTADTLAFRLDSGRVVWEDGAVEGVTADGVLGESPADQGERQDADAFLRDLLADGEPIPAGDVLKAARANGISDRTLKRAKSRLGVSSRRSGFGTSGQWHWWLPISKGAIQKLAPYGPLCSPQRVPKDANSNMAPLEETLEKETKSAKGANRGGPHPLDRCSSQLRWNPGA